VYVAKIQLMNCRHSR